MAVEPNRQITAAPLIRIHFNGLWKGLVPKVVPSADRSTRQVPDEVINRIRVPGEGEVLKGRRVKLAGIIEACERGGFIPVSLTALRQESGNYRVVAILPKDGILHDLDFPRVNRELEAQLRFYLDNLNFSATLYRNGGIGKGHFIWELGNPQFNNKKAPALGVALTEELGFSFLDL